MKKKKTMNINRMLAIGKTTNSPINQSGTNANNLV